jgi:hypothetical protein
MANTFTKISSQVITTGGVTGVINFTSIPQTYTDLKLVMSTRTSTASAVDNGYIQINAQGSTTGSWTRMYSTGTSVASDRSSNGSNAGPLVSTGGGSTAAVFASAEIYIPSYTSSSFKVFSSQAFQETNASGAYIYVNAGVIRDTNPVTTLSVNAYSFPLDVGSSFTLYGILKTA